MRRILFALSAVALAAAAPAADRPSSARKLRAVPFTDVKIADTFWAPRIETNRVKSIPHNFKSCRETGRFANFAKAGGLMEGGFQGIFFNDSDVFKVLEGTAYSLQAHPDPKLEKELDQVIAWIAAAQQPNGYLNTYYTLKEPDRKWTNCAVRHELYCAGHLFEAAVAHYRATGKKTLLNVATKYADRIGEIFGPDKRHDVPGHEEIELALVKLADVTGEKKYLDLAKFFIDIRGRKTDKRPRIYGPYCQDHQPVVEQSEPTGHAVRAMYLYSGMTDVAAATGRQDYIAALGRLWKNTVTRKMYLTGAIGSTSHGEAFGANYQLPNATAYGETCASIGMCLWNHRMNLLHADARYFDTFERTLFNGLLAGVDLSGEKFFYVNPLASRGNHHRQPFFGCACCPTNVVRFMPSLPGYVYARTDEGIYVNLFVAGKAVLARKDNAVTLTQTTGYPWDGKVTIRVDPATPAEFDLCVRIPGWAFATTETEGLYTLSPPRTAPIALTVAGKTEKIVRPGYHVIHRTWTRGDRVGFELPMTIHRVRAHKDVQADTGRVALQRGPIVYCLEGVDIPGPIEGIYLPKDAPLAAEHRKDLLGGVTVLTGKAMLRLAGDKDESVDITAVPYYAWDHRAPGEMAVWIPEDRAVARPRPVPTTASRAKVTASHLWQADTGSAVNDQIEPSNSNDHEIPRFTWWDHRGTTEWIQYTFAQPRKVSGVEVYWFNDKPRPGQCREPRSWRLLYRVGKEWKPVPGASKYGTTINQYNKVSFDPVTTSALRIEAKLQEQFSSGILEWRVTP